MPERGPQYLSSWQKRTLDVGVSWAALTIASPIVTGAAIIKYIEDGQMPFFLQDRVGKCGKTIPIVKVRSMDNDTSRPKPERITKFGNIIRKTHLDEIPNLVSVLAGDMSMVGPRVTSVDFLKTGGLREAENYKKMVPGATGLVAISRYNRKNGADLAVYDPNPELIATRRYYLDKYYYEHASLGLDVYILWRTAKIVGKNVLNQIAKAVHPKKLISD